MKGVALLLAGVGLGWCMKTGGSDAWVAVGCGAAWGGLVVGIFFTTDFALRVVRSQSRTLDEMRAELPPWPDPPSESL